MSSARSFLVLTVAIVAGLAHAGPALNLIPKPTEVVQHPGRFVISADTAIVADTDSANEALYLRTILQPVLGSNPRNPGRNRIRLSLAPYQTGLGDEGYRLDITPREVHLLAPKTAGLFYGIQTMRQLLPLAMDGRTKWDLPCVSITDNARFGWRGYMLDVSRHFFDKQQIERLLDLLALHKFNSFHWHLTDDGGWRIQIKKYPLLTTMGAWRTENKWGYKELKFPGPDYPQELYGGFYTQDDVREIVAYAADRHINIVPEIEMPGHSFETITSYPMLKCSLIPGTPVEAGNGYSNVFPLCAGKEVTFEFLQNVLDEVMALFPSKFIHVGGDEVDKWAWMHCADCQQRMKDQGLQTPEQLQSYFMKRMDAYITSKGRRMIGWDEILEGGLSPNAAVMSWRGEDGGIAAARQAHDVVMSPTSHCYFDYPYTTTPTEKVFSYVPVPPVLSKDERTHVLGAQANLWTEWVPDQVKADQMTWPRLLALSEVLWSTGKDNNWDDFSRRLTAYYPRLDALGVSFKLPPPSPEAEAVILDGHTVATLNDPGIPGGIIRYTLDGMPPTVASPVYAGPVRFIEPGTLTAAIFMGNASSDPVQIQAVAMPPAAPSQLSPGLDYRILTSQKPPSKVADLLEHPTEVAKGTTDTIGLLDKTRIENYGYQFTGFIKIDKAGIYRFYLSSDDGSTLSIAGAKVVNNDGPHGTVEKSGRIKLKAGTYPFEVDFYQGGGDQSLGAAIEGPGLPKQPIPTSMLFRGSGSAAR